ESILIQNNCQGVGDYSLVVHDQNFRFTFFTGVIGHPSCPWIPSRLHDRTGAEITKAARSESVLIIAECKCGIGVWRSSPLPLYDNLLNILGHIAQVKHSSGDDQIHQRFDYNDEHQSLGAVW